MLPTRRSAVSYSRFSSPLQADGDSADRQEREYRTFCERHNLTPGKEVFADRGRSGYHDAHRTHGRLGHLIEAAKGGRFEAGTVVVIEAWDRLGRLRPDRQTELVAELLRTGVSIGVCRLNDIFTEDDFGTHKWTTLAVFIQLAFQESKQKSERVGASWAQRRVKARESGTMLGGSLPAWIELADGKARLVPDRAATVRRIFNLAADGLGHTMIVKKLDAEKVPAFGARVVREGRTRSQFSGAWCKPYVALLLRDRRVLGEFQPMKAEKPDGPLLRDYFPACVTEEEFALARAAQEDRSNRDTLGRRSGPRQSKYVNLFKSMLTHTRDGEGFLLHNKGTGKKPDLMLINAVGNGGRGERSYTFPYFIFEEMILGLLKELDPATVLPQEPGSRSRADTLRTKLANHRTDLASIKQDLATGYSKGLADVLRTAEAAEEATLNELQDELARAAKPLTRVWEEVPSLIDLVRSAPDPDLVRLKLRPALRAITESAHMLIVPRGAWRFVAVQFRFVGGAHRNWLLGYLTAANQRKARSFAKSFAETETGEIDLRLLTSANKIEEFLTTVEVEKLVSAALAIPAKKSPAKSKARKRK